MSSGKPREVHGLENKSQTLVPTFHLVAQVCLPACSPCCPHTKVACSTPAKHYGNDPDRAARESHIHLSWISVMNVLWEGINNLTYNWIFCSFIQLFNCLTDLYIWMSREAQIHTRKRSLDVNPYNQFLQHFLHLLAYCFSLCSGLSPEFQMTVSLPFSKSHHKYHLLIQSFLDHLLWTVVNKGRICSLWVGWEIVFPLPWTQTGT